jgi:hypothetical protein
MIKLFRGISKPPMKLAGFIAYEPKENNTFLFVLRLKLNIISHQVAKVAAKM